MTIECYGVGFNYPMIHTKNLRQINVSSLATKNAFRIDDYLRIEFVTIKRCAIICCISYRTGQRRLVQEIVSINHINSDFEAKENTSAENYIELPNCTNR
jgi:hypothetical protein